MSTSHTPITRLKIVVPVMALGAAFIIYTWGIFVSDFRVTQVIGALVTFISCILWIIARVQLGDAPRENRLVTTGLYGEVRHPIYYFSVTAFAGFAIFINIPFFYGVLAGFLVFQVLRIKQEEKALSKKLGRRYLRYKQRTIL